jgi:DNA helicase-2/ATP-dependent DNA helicase PcrA
MAIQLCKSRQRLLATRGHILAVGGPGSGKTTISLLKAADKTKELQEGQEVLFLSFSRAAVRQILTRCKQILDAEKRARIQVQTYHSFCLETLRSHGRLLNGREVRFLFPSDEKMHQAKFPGDWLQERQRLANQDSIYCFDLVAKGTADLLERCQALRELVSDKYPMIIVDEFQDTDDDQWRIILSLSEKANIFCLADPDQRIFEYRGNVDPKRVDNLRTVLRPHFFDFSGDNHRSDEAPGILSFADAVLNNKPLPPGNSHVRTNYYYGSHCGEAVHASVVWTFSSLIRRGIQKPSVAVLATTNAAVARISFALNEHHKYQNQVLTPVDHDVVWDAELSATAAMVVGTILEWPRSPIEYGIPKTLRAISNFFLLKNADRPSNSAVGEAEKYLKAASVVEAGGKPRGSVAQALIGVFNTGLDLTGIPPQDWVQARQVLQSRGALDEIFRAVRLVRLFRAGDALSDALSEKWLQMNSYSGAAETVKQILEREQLIASERDPEGCVVMNVHKSKGKEFDAVVLVEERFSSKFFNRHEQPPYHASRRLLRVGITRARLLVYLARPNGAEPLVA